MRERVGLRNRRSQVRILSGALRRRVALPAHRLFLVEAGASRSTRLVPLQTVSCGRRCSAYAAHSRVGGSRRVDCRSHAVPAPSASEVLRSAVGRRTELGIVRREDLARAIHEAARSGPTRRPRLDPPPGRHDWPSDVLGFVSGQTTSMVRGFSASVGRSGDWLNRADLQRIRASQRVPSRGRM